MLELLGKSYVIDHCINYLKKTNEETALKVYITDALKAVVENTGKSINGGVAMRSRFIDILNEAQEEDQEDAEEKAEKIKANMKRTLARLGKGDAENG